MPPLGQGARAPMRAGAQSKASGKSNSLEAGLGQGRRQQPAELCVGGLATRLRPLRRCGAAAVGRLALGRVGGRGSVLSLAGHHRQHGGARRRGRRLLRRLLWPILLSARGARRPLPPALGLLGRRLRELDGWKPGHAAVYGSQPRGVCVDGWSVPRPRRPRHRQLRPGPDAGGSASAVAEHLAEQDLRLLHRHRLLLRRLGHALQASAPSRLPGRAPAPPAAAAEGLRWLREPPACLRAAWRRDADRWQAASLLSTPRSHS
mmetsp:Transcript_144326/g.350408  ORF Transcript_144326/g.350408 Transcript_144326/m.350408 type:complete len:262 (+) Transcript_144326:52-837(+)